VLSIQTMNSINVLQDFTFTESDFDSVIRSQVPQTIYNDLQSLMSLEQLIRNREELHHHKEIISEMSTIDNVNELLLHGLSEEEIATIHTINTNVKKGKELIISTLRDYDACLDEIQQTNNNISITNTTITSIKKQLEGLSRIHEDLAEISTPFLTSLLEKQQNIIDELQSSIGLLVCKKDKLEATLRALGTSYNIIKNAPMHHTCPICITNEVDIYLDPCGHTLCRQCNRGTHCHMCRTKIRSVRSMYYS